MIHRYKTLAPHDAFYLIEQFQQGNNINDISRFEITKMDGQDYPEDEVEQLKKRIYDEMATKREIAADNEKGLVESNGAKWLDQILTYDKNAFADSGFWLWMTVKYFKEFIEWRFRTNSRPGPVSISNYGLQSSFKVNIVENLLHSMWVRAKVGRDNSLKDSYFYVTKTNARDLYLAFISRTKWSNVKTIANVFLQKKYDMKLTTDEHRFLGKSLRAYRANLFLDIYDKNQMDVIADNLINNIRKVKN